MTRESSNAFGPDGPSRLGPAARRTGRWGVLALAAAVTASPAGRADAVHLRDSTVLADVQVQSIDGTAVACAGRAAIPIATVARIRFDRFLVARRPTGVVLTDGSVLSGVLRKLGTEKAVFRSVTFGSLDLGRDQLAAVYYDPAAAEAGLDPTAGLDEGAGELVRVDGRRLSGNVMWADAQSAGILGRDGLSRVPAAEIHCIVFAPGKPVANTVLRNGDRLGPVRAGGAGALVATVAGVELALAFEAVLELTYANPDSQVHEPGR